MGLSILLLNKTKKTNFNLNCCNEYGNQGSKTEPLPGFYIQLPTLGSFFVTVHHD
jgi:hypothetical protein